MNFSWLSNAFLSQIDLVKLLILVLKLALDLFDRVLHSSSHASDTASVKYLLIISSTMKSQFTALIFHKSYRFVKVLTVFIVNK